MLSLITWNQARTQSREERLLALSCPSLSLCPRVSERLPLDRFPSNLILRTFMKICREFTNLFRIGEYIGYFTRSPKYVLLFSVFLYCWQLNNTHTTHCCSSISTLLKRTSVTIYKSTWTTIPEAFICKQTETDYVVNTRFSLKNGRKLNVCNIGFVRY